MDFLKDKSPRSTLLISLVGLVLFFNLFIGKTNLIGHIILFYLYGILLYWYIKKEILTPIVNSLIMLFLLIISSFTVTYLETFYPNISGTLFPLYLTIFFSSLSIHEYFKLKFSSDFLRRKYIGGLLSLILSLVFISITFLLYNYLTINSVVIAIIIGIIYIFIEIIIASFFLT